MKTIRTEADLDQAVDELSIKDLKDIVKEIAFMLYVDEDDHSLDINKEQNSDAIEHLTQVLTANGIYPTDSDGPVESNVPYDKADFGGTEQ